MVAHCRAIRFCRDSCSETGAWKALAEELLQEHQILLADVDLASQTRLRKRFSPYISDDFDVFIIMLRRKKMYVNQDGLKNQDFESVRQWILSGWEMEEPKDVPDEASPIGELLEKIQMYLVCFYVTLGLKCEWETNFFRSALLMLVMVICSPMEREPTFGPIPMVTYFHYYVLLWQYCCTSCYEHTDSIIKQISVTTLMIYTCMIGMALVPKA